MQTHAGYKLHRKLVQTKLNPSHQYAPCVFVLVATAPPPAPQNLHVTSSGRDQVTIAWDAAAGDAQPVRNYVVEMYSLDDPEFIEKFAVDAARCSFSASGLQPGGSGYVFSVRAENELGLSDSAAELDSPVLAGVCPLLSSFLYFFSVPH